MGRTVMGSIEPRISDLAARLRKLEVLSSQERGPRMSEKDRVQDASSKIRQRTEIADQLPLDDGDLVIESNNQSLLAAVGDADGDEKFRIRVYTVGPDNVQPVYLEAPISPRVLAFGRGFLWIRRDQSLRPHQLIWWDGACSDPTILIDEVDPECRLELRSTDGDAAILVSRGARTSRSWVVTCVGQGVPSCQLVKPRGPDDVVTISQQSLVVLDRQNGHLWDHERDHMLSETPNGFAAENLQRSNGGIIVIGRFDGRKAVWVPEQGTSAIWIAPPAGTILPAFDSADNRLKLLVSSPVHKPQVVPATEGTELLLEPNRPVSTIRMSASSEDGTRIPITLFLPPGERKYPVVVHVYGAYGISLEGPFDPFNDDLLAREVAVAFCHVRGGGELGAQWHRQATGKHRHRSVNDLLACLAEIRSLPHVDSERVAVTAASAGGLVAAAACLRQPTWIRGLHLVHPFIDPLATLLDPSSNLSSTDRAEYGDPREDVAIRNAIERISPLACLEKLLPRSHPLPRAWIRAAERDARADGEAIYEFAQRYRSVSVARHPGHVIHRIAGGGHLHGGSYEDAINENALAHAWMLDVLEVTHECSGR